MAKDSLLWNGTARRSRRRSPPPPSPHFTANELAAAQALILLSNSLGGGFSIATAPPRKHQEVLPNSSAAAKKPKPTSPNSPLPTAPLYHCSICGKDFDNSQALGGHMTSHRVKITIADEEGRRNGTGSSSAAAESGRVHECSVCSQTFPTGQALGGHKRRHYEGPTLARKAVKCEASSSNSSPTRIAIAGETSAAAAAAEVRPIIDLNLPPPPEFEFN